MAAGFATADKAARIDDDRIPAATRKQMKPVSKKGVLDLPAVAETRKISRT